MLMGIVLSVGLAIALDVTNVASRAESLLAALMGTTLSLVLDSSARAERRFELRGLVADTQWLAQAMTSMAHSTRDIMGRYPGDIEADARRRMERLCDELEELRRGRIMRPRTDYHDLISATETCQNRLEAVTNVTDEPIWWDSPIGQHYWRVNLDAIARGVTISRVFVCERLGADLIALVELQRRAGVSVAVVDRRDIDPALHLNVVVWDRQRAWEGRMNARGEIVANVFVVNQAEVDRIHGVFETCTAAHRLAEV